MHLQCRGEGNSSELGGHSGQLVLQEVWNVQ